FLEETRSHLDPGVRVDAPAARLGDWLLPVEREPRGVGEQVTQRRAGRTGGLVEIDGSLLEGHEHGETGEKLRDRRPRPGDVARPVRRDDAVAARDSGRGLPRLPAV